MLSSCCWFIFIISTYIPYPFSPLKIDAFLLESVFRKGEWEIDVMHFLETIREP